MKLTTTQTQGEDSCPHPHSLQLECNLLQTARLPAGEAGLTRRYGYEASVPRASMGFTWLAHAGKESAPRAMENSCAIHTSMAAITLVSHFHVCFS